MKLLTIKKIVIFTVELFLIICLVLIYQSNQKIQHLSQRVLDLEQRLVTDSARISPAPTNDFFHQEIDRLHTGLALLTEQVEQRPSCVQCLADAATDELAVVAQNKQSTTSTPAPTHPDQASTIVDKIIAAGYVDTANWQEVDESLKLMNPEENKAFWQAMFSQLENGNLQLYIDQE